MTSGTSGFLKDVSHLDWSAFNLPVGLRAAAFVVLPAIVAFAINQPVLFFATIGALFLVNTEGLPPTHSGRVLFVACITEATAIGLGTLAATTGEVPSFVLLGLFMFVALLARGSWKWGAVGTFTAITFTLGVGLPGYSVEAAGLRATFCLLGGFWALLGVELHRFVDSRRKPRVTPAAATPSGPHSRLETVIDSLAVATACALGFALGFALGLPRDFWVVITIVFTVRPRLGSTLEFTAEMAAGTVVGAMIAAVITLGTANAYVLSAVLFGFAAMMFATRGVNLASVQLFITPFIIILINILFPGQWYLALYRIADVGIGVVIAIGVASVLGAIKKSRNVIYR